MGDLLGLLPLPRWPLCSSRRPSVSLALGASGMEGNTADTRVSLQQVSETRGCLLALRSLAHPDHGSSRHRGGTRQRRPTVRRMTQVTSGGLSLYYQSPSPDNEMSGTRAYPSAAFTLCNWMYPQHQTAFCR